MKELINVLVVDDSAIFRKIISDIIAAWPDFNVVGVAVNGRDALMKIARLKPHLVILDMEMPVMNGLETLQAIQDQYPEVETLMCSVLTQRAAEITMKALEFGAFDFIPKPRRRQCGGKLSVTHIRTAGEGAGLPHTPKSAESTSKAAPHCPAPRRPV